MDEEELYYPLTREQYEIAEQSPERPMLVLAPPGTGKTHTVVARILYLIDEHGLSPNEILVLCFTRAAVHEVTRRLRELVNRNVHDDLRFVSVRTFDSFATSLLIGTNDRIDLKGANYNKRIKMAVDALSDDKSEASQAISGIQHLIVDEIQDLAGIRAALVRILLMRIGGGFTLLGDPAQSIYDFTLASDPVKLTPDQLLVWVHNQEWEPELKICKLTKNYRNTGLLSEQMSNLREELLKDGLDGKDQLAYLEHFIGDLASVGGMPELASNHKGVPGSVCILCRTNGEALYIATTLGMLGKRCLLRPLPEDRGLPAWLGRVLGTCTSPGLSKGEFEARWKDLISSGSVASASRVWSWLKRMEGQRNSDLDMGKLISRLYKGRSFPDDLDALNPEVSEGSFSISTIHQAKGKEFDHVIILQPESRWHYQNELTQEARVLYVAATRAKMDLARIDRSQIPYIHNSVSSSGANRWIASTCGGSVQYMETGISQDVELGSTVWKPVVQNSEDARRIQEYMWNSVRPGDQVTLVASTQSRQIEYRATHQVDTDQGSRYVGLMSPDFALDVIGLSGNGGSGYRAVPKYIRGASVTAIVTEVLPPFPENVHEPYATSRLCLGLKLRGMGKIHTRSMKRDTQSS